MSSVSRSASPKRFVASSKAAASVFVSSSFFSASGFAGVASSDFDGGGGSVTIVGSGSLTLGARPNDAASAASSSSNRISSVSASADFFSDGDSPKAPINASISSSFGFGLSSSSFACSWFIIIMKSKSPPIEKESIGAEAPVFFFVAPFSSFTTTVSDLKLRRLPIVGPHKSSSSGSAGAVVDALASRRAAITSQNRESRCNMESYALAVTVAVFGGFCGDPGLVPSFRRSSASF
mmetsp:Transcript_22252/g.33121  ORF Transcript_22252/g.33121 Transcript_22252/m.33121 type:complete len:236 (+) Transcript_22252:173-880(+)